MKKILFALFVLLPTLTLIAQTTLPAQNQSFEPYWTLGIQNGFAQSRGFVDNNSFFLKLGSESKATFGISIERQISPVISIKAKYSNSSLYSTGSQLTDSAGLKPLAYLSASGSINEYGIYATLSLNKLFSNNKISGSDFNVYISSGIGYADWKSQLKDTRTNYLYGEIKNSTVYNYHVTSSFDTSTFKIVPSSRLVYPLTFGINFRVIDGFYISLEHSIHFMTTGLLEVRTNGITNHYTTTTFGISVKLDKLGAGHKKANNVAPVSTSDTQTTTEKKTAKKLPKGIPKTQPELQEYSGYNGMLPPPVQKADTSLKAKAAVAPTTKNVWVPETDSGRVEITGGKNQIKEIVKESEPQITGLVPAYRVQIQASKTYISADAVIKKLGLTEKISVELRPDGWYRYYVGQFTELVDAKKKLAEMRAKGVKDSFVVYFKSNIRQIIK